MIISSPLGESQHFLINEVVSVGRWSKRISVLIRGDTRELVFSLHLVETKQEGGQAHLGREVSPEASPTDSPQTEGKQISLF